MLWLLPRSPSPPLLLLPGARYCFACLFTFIHSIRAFVCTLDWSSKNGNEKKKWQGVSKVKEEENKNTFWTVHKYGCNGFCIWITGCLYSFCSVLSPLVSSRLLFSLPHLFDVLPFLFVSTSVSTLQCKLIRLYFFLHRSALSNPLAVSVVVYTVFRPTHSRPRSRRRVFESQWHCSK